MREAWASTIGSLLPDGFDSLSVLDAFAGSGALGFEALSRGAARLCFCENDRRALALLRENISSLTGDDSGSQGQSQVKLLALDVFAPSALKQLKASAGFDLVILDPPYSIPVGRIKSLLHALATTGCLNNGALVSYEHRAGERGGAATGLDGTVLCAACSPASLRMASCKSYGGTEIEYLFYQ